MGDPSALLVAVTGCALCALGCWILALVFDEVGWIDRLWSLAPVGYALWFASAGGFGARAALMAALVSAWGARLTYNFWRKGGYRLGGEDYRWDVLRQRLAGWRWQLFNVTYVASLQNAILLGMVLPMWPATAPDAVPLGVLDVLAAGLFVLLLLGETVADEQQWRFHEAKRRRRERGEPEGRGFLDRGMFRFSRHPNFFCEMGMWWAFYLFSVAAGAGWLNVTGLGALVLTLQFQGSTAMTERLSAEKYPDYADYQRRTSRLVPWWPRREPRDEPSE
jgi:steroid 5-alpha reductase family enzyme